MRYHSNLQTWTTSGSWVALFTAPADMGLSAVREVLDRLVLDAHYPLPMKHRGDWPIAVKLELDKMLLEESQLIQGAGEPLFTSCSSFSSRAAKGNSHHIILCPNGLQHLVHALTAVVSNTVMNKSLSMILKANWKVVHLDWSGYWIPEWPAKGPFYLTWWIACSRQANGSTWGKLAGVWP